MTKFYLIIPIGLLIAFMVYYTQAAKPAMIARAEVERLELAAQEAEKERLRQEADAAARAELQKQREGREKKEREREEQIRLDKEKRDRDLIEATESYKAQAAELNEERAEIDKEIEQQRNLREQLSQEAFDLAKQVEQAKIERRKAELDIQRMHDMIVDEAGEQAEKLRLELEAQEKALAETTKKKK